MVFILDTPPVVSLRTKPSRAQGDAIINNPEFINLLSRLFFDLETASASMPIEGLISRFFILPALFAGTSASSQLEYIGPCAEYLLGNLSWLSGILSLTHDDPLSDISLTAYIESYILNNPEKVYISYLNTLITCAMLDTLIEVVKKDSEAMMFVKKFEQLKRVCHLFLGNPSMIFQKTEQYFILYMLLNSLNDRQKINPIIGKNPYYDVIKKNFSEVSNCFIGRYATIISKLLSTLSHPKGDMVYIIEELAVNPEKPLIYIARISYQLLLDIIDRLIKSDYPDKIKHSFLSLMISCLKPTLKQPESRVREDFLIVFYNRYALNQSKERDLVFKVLTSIYLNEQNLCSKSDPAWSNELVYLSDDFSFAFAFCLSRINYPQEDKEKLFNSAMKIINRSLGIVVNWFIVLRIIELRFKYSQTIFFFFPTNIFL